MQYAAIHTVKFLEWEDLQAEIKLDERLKQIIQDLAVKNGEHPGYNTNQGRLYYQGRLVIPKGSLKINSILREFHDSAVGGHSGFFRTYKRISRFSFLGRIAKEHTKVREEM